MPRLTALGPDLPAGLLEAHAEGRLILFCGAGVSRLRARHPGFEELVTRAFEDVGTLTPEADEAIKSSEFDRALEILEKDVGPPQTRRAVMRILDEPPVTDLRVHEMLLELATTSEGRCRLVTTNFDDLFSRADPSLLCDSAPKLPVPKPHKWTGLVHLHGSIRDPAPDGVNLVLTRADFGNAYLLERWASRFVTELFRNFSVLFVGYAVDDPVLRYLVDAIAVERGRTDVYKRAYALAGVKGSRAKVMREEAKWKSKGLEPLFFHSGWRFKHLHETLRNWTDLYSGGLQSRTYFVLKSADNPPPSAEDDVAKLVVWALSEPSGAVARAFASRDPTPPIEWLRIFEESSHLPDGRKLLALLHPDSPPGDGSPMLGAPLLDNGEYKRRTQILSPVTHQLGRWLARHVSDPALLQWVLAVGRSMHPVFRAQLRAAAQEQAGLHPTLLRLWAVATSEALAAQDMLTNWIADDF